MMHDTIHNPTPPPTRRDAFTLIELIVAIGVASLLLFLVNFVFNDATRAVSRGIALSDVIANTRGASDQIDIDARVMVGPTPTPATDSGGFLIIANHQVNAVARRGPRLREVPVTVRADQLVFIRKRDDGGNQLIPIAPKATSTFLNDFLRDTDNVGSSYTAEHVRVWYGHIQRTQANGGAGGTLGNAGNRVANDWILGRQAMFLVDQGQPDTAGPTVSADGKWDLAPAHIQAHTARYNAIVGGYGDATSPPAATVPRLAYTGYADMCRQILGRPDMDIRGRIPGDPGFDNSIPSILRDITNAGAATTAQYRANAYNYTYMAQRLWGNDSPQIQPNNIYGLASWQIAQQHPLFMAHVSDFIVEFAADTNLDGTIDTDANGIIWYSHYNLPPAAYSNQVYDGPVPAPHNANASGAFVWRHDDANGAITGSATQPSYWPYLIRVRYRMHDSRGVIESANDQHGMWFEHILPVARP